MHVYGATNVSCTQSLDDLTSARGMQRDGTLRYIKGSASRCIAGLAVLTQHMLTLSLRWENIF